MAGLQQAERTWSLHGAPWLQSMATGRKREWPLKPRKQAQTVALDCHRLRATFHGKQGVCRGLPPVARGPLPEREEFDLIKTPSPANPRVRGFKTSVHAAARWYSWISPPSRSRRLISSLGS